MPSGRLDWLAGRSPPCARDALQRNRHVAARVLDALEQRAEGDPRAGAAAQQQVHVKHPNSRRSDPELVAAARGRQRTMQRGAREPSQAKKRRPPRDRAARRTMMYTKRPVRPNDDEPLRSSSMAAADALRVPTGDVSAACAARGVVGQAAHMGKRIMLVAGTAPRMRYTILPMDLSCRALTSPRFSAAFQSPSLIILNTLTNGCCHTAARGGRARPGQATAMARERADCAGGTPHRSRSTSEASISPGAPSHVAAILNLGTCADVSQDVMIWSRLSRRTLSHFCQHGVKSVPHLLGGPQARPPVILRRGGRSGAAPGRGGRGGRPAVRRGRRAAAGWVPEERVLPRLAVAVTRAAAVYFGAARRDRVRHLLGAGVRGMGCQLLERREMKRAPETPEGAGARRAPSSTRLEHCRLSRSPPVGVRATHGP